jgi:TolB protein
MTKIKDTAMAQKNSSSRRFSIILFGALAAIGSLFLAGCSCGYKGFDSDSNIGTVAHAGSTRFIGARQEYEITGGGTNMWGTEDAFRYVRKEASGDWSLKAKIRWIGKGKNEHRKAGWMIRQDLTADSPYVDAVVHGSGLTSMQFRKTKGGQTEDISSPVSAPAYLQLQRQGDIYTLSVSTDGKFYKSTESVTIPLKDPVYIGLAVCSHDDTTTETAVFSDVEMKPL